MREWAVAHVVSWRGVLVVALMVTGGCLDHCGPTLESLNFTVDFDGALNEANRTAARSAFEAMGYVDAARGSDGFQMVKGSVAIFISDHTAGEHRKTGITYRQDLPNHEYESLEQARAEGHAAAERAHWSEFNATLVEFRGKTGWTVADEPTVDPLVYIC